MGGQHSDSAVQTFNKQDWQLLDNNSKCKVWANRRDSSLRVYQYDIFSESDQTYKAEKNMYYLRKNNPYLVAALYQQSQEQNDFCSSNYRQKLYIESIPIRLSDIEHIPFPDYLHLYNQTLNGFKQLAETVGYFAVEQEYIGINERGVVKVWMNQSYEKGTVVGCKLSQQIMVRSIIELVDRNVDQGQLPRNIPSVRNYLYRNVDTLRFEQAIAELNAYVHEYQGGVLANKLECIDRVGGIQAIANRNKDSSLLIPKENNQRLFDSAHQQVVQLNRPQLVDQNLNGQYASSTRIPEGYGHTQQTAQYHPLRGSEAIREQMIVNPVAIRGSLPIVRRSTGSSFQNGSNIVGSAQAVNNYPALYNQSPVFNQPPIYNQQVAYRQPQPNQPVYNQPIINQSIVNKSQQLTNGTSIFYPTPAQQLMNKNQNIVYLRQGEKIPTNSSQIIQNNNFPVNHAVMIRGAPVGSAIRQLQPQPQSRIQPTFNQALLVRGAPVGSALPLKPSFQNSFLIKGAPIGSSVPIQESNTDSFLIRGAPIGSSQTPARNSESIIPVQVQSQNKIRNNVHQDVSSSLINMITKELPETANKNNYSIQNNNAQQWPGALNFQKIREEQQPVIQQKQYYNFGLSSQPTTFTEQNNAKSTLTQNVEERPSYQFNSPTYEDNRQIAMSFNPAAYENKTSNYTANYDSVNMDDGKSSLQFLNKIKDFSTNGTYNKDSAYSASFKNDFSSGSSYQTDKINYENNYYDTTYNPSSTQKNAFAASEMDYDDEQFGRAAVSNIISTAPVYGNSNKASTSPLKFEKGIDMKYSVLESQQAMPQYSYGGYAVNYDPELLQDMNQLRQ